MIPIVPPIEQLNEIFFTFLIFGRPRTLFFPIEKFCFIVVQLASYDP